VLAMARKYYASLGMPVDDILARSDLYEKPGKSPHAFSTDIDRAGDIRILCNVRPNLEWMDTLLHELGHSVYDKYIDPELPFELRQASHAITTEGIAMMFDYLAHVVGLDPESAAKAGESARRYLRAEKLIFSRWAQVMVRFEHGMYNDPDQDLARLWWDLKKQYQLLNPPDDLSRPDYGAKIHIVTTPVYYHGYLLGDLFAAQVQAEIARDVLGGVDPTRTSFFGHAEAGTYLRQKVFGPGDLYSWNELTQRATGEPLSPKYFVQLYVQ
jgi:peptidyl-dipeptidase A